MKNIFTLKKSITILRKNKIVSEALFYHYVNMDVLVYQKANTSEKKCGCLTLLFSSNGPPIIDYPHSFIFQTPVRRRLNSPLFISLSFPWTMSSPDSLNPKVVKFLNSFPF